MYSYPDILKQQVPTDQITDELCINLLNADVKEYLNGDKSKLEDAKRSIKGLRDNFSLTSFDIAKRLGVRLINIMELLR